MARTETQIAAELLAGHFLTAVKLQAQVEAYREALAQAQQEVAALKLALEQLKPKEGA